MYKYIRIKRRTLKLRTRETNREVITLMSFRNDAGKHTMAGLSGIVLHKNAYERMAREIKDGKYLKRFHIKEI